MGSSMVDEARRTAQEGFTAADYSHMADHLDSQILLAIKNGDERTVYDLAQLKHELIEALDNHPDPNVATVWKKGREAFMAPERIEEAYDLGRQLLDPRTRLDLMQQRFKDATAAELKALKAGVRADADDRCKGRERGEANLRSMLSTEARGKIAWLVGPERAQAFLAEIEKEAEMAESAAAVRRGKRPIS